MAVLKKELASKMIRILNHTPAGGMNIQIINLDICLNFIIQQVNSRLTKFPTYVIHLPNSNGNRRDRVDSMRYIPLVPTSTSQHLRITLESITVLFYNGFKWHRTVCLK